MIEMYGGQPYIANVTHWGLARIMTFTKTFPVTRSALYSPHDYASGYALYAFDLSADLGEDDHFSLVRQGSVRLAMKFAVALPAIYYLRHCLR